MKRKLHLISGPVFPGMTRLKRELGDAVDWFKAAGFGLTVRMGSGSSWTTDLQALNGYSKGLDLVIFDSFAWSPPDAKTTDRIMQKFDLKHTQLLAPPAFLIAARYGNRLLHGKTEKSLEQYAQKACSDKRFHYDQHFELWCARIGRSAVESIMINADTRVAPLIQQLWRDLRLEPKLSFVQDRQLMTQRWDFESLMLAYELKVWRLRKDHLFYFRKALRLWQSNHEDHPRAMTNRLLDDVNSRLTPMMQSLASKTGQRETSRLSLPKSDSNAAQTRLPENPELFIREWFEPLIVALGSELEKEREVAGWKPGEEQQSAERYRQSIVALEQQVRQLEQSVNSPRATLRQLLRWRHRF